MRRQRAITEFRAYAGSLLSEAGSTPATTPDTVRPRVRPQWWRSPAVALSSMGFLVFGNIGMAAAADSAVPGDLLYSIDRAYESIGGLVGLDNGGSTERLQEASVLLGRGDFVLAVETIAEAAAEVDDEAATILLALSAEMSTLDAGEVAREGLHGSVAALVAAVRDMASNTADRNPSALRASVVDSARVVGETAHGQPFTPPGQDDDFIPPGLDDKATPPGLDDKATPPGLDDKIVPPAQTDDSIPPEQDDDFTPPGQDDNFTPPGHRKGQGGRN